MDGIVVDVTFVLGSVFNAGIDCRQWTQVGQQTEHSHAFPRRDLTMFPLQMESSCVFYTQYYHTFDHL